MTGESATTELLGHGAEGRVYAGSFHGQPVVIKERAAKRYRVPELDMKLTRQRVVQEAKCMAKCRRTGVLTPAIFMVDKTTNSIVMERIEGQTVKSMLKSLKDISECNQEVIVHIGNALALMHDADIVHGSHIQFLRSSYNVPNRSILHRGLDHFEHDDTGGGFTACPYRLWARCDETVSRG